MRLIDRTSWIKNWHSAMCLIQDDLTEARVVSHTNAAGYFIRVSNNLNVTDEIHIYVCKKIESNEVDYILTIWKLGSRNNIDSYLWDSVNRSALGLDLHTQDALNAYVQQQYDGVVPLSHTNYTGTSADFTDAFPVVISEDGKYLAVRVTSEYITLATSDRTVNKEIYGHDVFAASDRNVGTRFTTLDSRVTVLEREISSIVAGNRSRFVAR